MAIKQSTRTNGTRVKWGSDGKLWDDAPVEFTRRSALILVWGDTGTGRTTLGLSAPGPIAIFHAGEKLPGIIEPFAKKIGPHGNGKDGVHNFTTNFKGGEDEIKKQAMPVLANFHKAWVEANSWARTKILDTHTDLYKLVRLARFGKVAQVKPIHYGPVNAEILGFFGDFRSHYDPGYNIVAIGKATDEYKADQATGKREQSGQKEIPNCADIIVRTVKAKGTFKAIIEKGWMNAWTEGTELENEDINWGTLLETVTQIDAAEWE